MHAEFTRVNTTDYLAGWGCRHRRPLLVHVLSYVNVKMYDLAMESKCSNYSDLGTLFQTTYVYTRQSEQKNSKFKSFMKALHIQRKANYSIVKSQKVGIVYHVVPAVH